MWKFFNMIFYIYLVSFTIQKTTKINIKRITGLYKTAVKCVIKYKHSQQNKENKSKLY